MLAEESQIIEAATQLSVPDLEAKMLTLPQVECPVVHHFGPGIYIREVTIPAGTLAIGHMQRFEHLNILLKGAVSMIGEDGQIKILRAPLLFTGQPGRKFGYALEDTIWQNIYATEERDIETLEATFIDKSETWKAYAEAAEQIETASRNADREDFAMVLEQSGFTAELVKQQSENTDDQILLAKCDAPKLAVRDSSIHGKGIFVSSPVLPGEIIAPARLSGMRTQAGRYTNHSKMPNAVFVKEDSGDIYLVATRHIAGCQGGGNGEEVTVDYRQALSLSGIFIEVDKS